MECVFDFSQLNTRNGIVEFLAQRTYFPGLTGIR